MNNLYQYECHLVESSSPLLSLERNYKISSLYFDKTFFILTSFFELVLEGNFRGRICHQVLSDASEKSPKQYLQTWNFLLKQKLMENFLIIVIKNTTHKNKGDTIFSFARKESHEITLLL